jgi:hypothetical protein
MRDTFERHGGAWFQPCAQLHVAGGTFRAASEPKPLPQQQQQQQQAGTEPGQEAEAAEAWQSQWAEAGWLHENPLVGWEAGWRRVGTHPCLPGGGRRRAGAGAARTPVPILLCLHPPRSSPILCHVQDVPTEREVLTEEQGLPVYRLMLRRV